MGDLSADHLQATVITLLERIMDEALERIEGDLSEQDRAAMLTAVQKAGMEGARAGVIEMAARISELSPDVSLNVDLSTFRPVDRWAQLYGPDAAA